MGGDFRRSLNNMKSYTRLVELIRNVYFSGTEAPLLSSTPSSEL